jgi:NAD-dependent deacetylase
LVSSVVDFGDPLPQNELQNASYHSSQCDLFLVVGSSLVVSPANEMPRIALESGARLVIINQGETPLDNRCHLRFEERIGEVLPPTVERLKGLIKSS